ncbi:MAG: prepilin-type N-terminal cleavage/methylation domain-containing protein [Candidatus Omnitrophica bacterium]|nr:prepilin-type N-terminal cleavage/methylation domain-containing protein [Candidatus Omnitrophota bacterium]
MGKKKTAGFTLLELLIVVIIIGILASLAMPQFLKTKEKSYMAEALAILGAIRNSEIRYYANQSTYTLTVAELDFNPSDVAGTVRYAYTIPTAFGGPAPNFIVQATRQTGGALPPIPIGCTAGYTLRISRAGTVCGADCQSAGGACAP